MAVDKLTAEQMQALEGLDTPEQILSYVQEQGLELSDEQLEAVSGGDKDWAGRDVCPNCGADNFIQRYQGGLLKCYVCSHEWYE